MVDGFRLGRPFRRRTATSFDRDRPFTLGALAIDVDQEIKGEKVFDAMLQISSVRSVRKTISVDNNLKVISKALDHWTYESGVTPEFSRPGKPTDNAFVVGQRPPARRVPEHALIPVPGGRRS